MIDEKYIPTREISMVSHIHLLLVDEFQTTGHPHIHCVPSLTWDQGLGHNIVYNE